MRSRTSKPRTVKAANCQRLPLTPVATGVARGLYTGNGHFRSVNKRARNRFIRTLPERDFSRLTNSPPIVGSLPETFVFLSNWSDRCPLYIERHTGGQTAHQAGCRRTNTRNVKSNKCIRNYHTMEGSDIFM